MLAGGRGLKRFKEKRERTGAKVFLFRLEKSKFRAAVVSLQ